MKIMSTVLMIPEVAKDEHRCFDGSVQADGKMDDSDITQRDVSSSAYSNPKE
jgi:hypothetical protein